jgi:hypothetical protein
MGVFPNENATARPFGKPQQQEKCSRNENFQMSLAFDGYTYASVALLFCRDRMEAEHTKHHLADAIRNQHTER